MKEQGREIVKALFESLQPRKIWVWDSKIGFSGEKKQPRTRNFSDFAAPDEACSIEKYEF